MNSRLNTLSLVTFIRFSLMLTILFIVGCTGVTTFPTAARQGDTVAVMVGGSEKATKSSLAVTMTDSDSVEWDLQTLGLVKSVFNLRPEGRAYGYHYSDFFDVENAWYNAHEPMQTVLIFDVPVGAAEGTSTLSVDLNTDDDSSGVDQPYSINLDVLPQVGESTDFDRQNFDGSTDILDYATLEPAPHAKISFGTGSGFNYVSATPSDTLGAAEIIVSFDNTVLNGNDINVYVAETTIKGNAQSTDGPFGQHQRMVTWKIDSNQLKIYIIAPNGIEDRYLQVYVMHPRDLSGDPLLNLVSTTGYDLNGFPIIATPQFNYYP